MTADEINKLVDGVSNDTINACAKMAEGHHLRSDGDYNAFREGYNRAAADIAAAIRKLTDPQ